MEAVSGKNVLDLPGVAQRIIFEFYCFGGFEAAFKGLLGNV
jgi:hypothetical protein